MRGSTEVPNDDTHENDEIDVSDMGGLSRQFHSCVGERRTSTKSKDRQRNLKWAIWPIEKNSQSDYLWTYLLWWMASAAAGSMAALGDT